LIGWIGGCKYLLFYCFVYEELKGGEGVVVVGGGGLEDGIL